MLAWLLRHPAKIQPIIGTTNPDRIRATAQAENVTLTREEWYTLYTTARGHRWYNPARTEWALQPTSHSTAGCG